MPMVRVVRLLEIARADHVNIAAHPHVVRAMPELIQGALARTQQQHAA